MWLPVSLGSNQETRFLEPDKEFTLTIPSTAEKVISAGAYDVRYQSYADFSGRGDQRYGVKLSLIHILLFVLFVFLKHLQVPPVKLLYQLPSGYGHDPIRH